MAEAEPTTTGDQPVDTTISQTITEVVSEQRFHAWYAEQQIEDNILNGQWYFNQPSPPPDPEKHIPSKLLQCHRKVHYARQNAPKETAVPDGLFWFGTEFEEQVIVPFLQDVSPDGIYVQNGIWVNETIEHNGHELLVKGSTDPALVTEDATPLVLSEVKTTLSIENKVGPSPHHRAQLTAYLYALNQEYEHDVTGLVIYCDRESFDLVVFEIPFDPDFWDDIVEWMDVLTRYEAVGDLPPAQPEHGWECQYCDFRNRCGKTDEPYADVGPGGLLPLFDGYGRENIVEYLNAHENAKLTPTLAQEHPDLAKEYGAYDWRCTTCSETFQWDAIEPNDNTNATPYCPACVEDGDLCVVRGPEPSEQ